MMGLPAASQEGGGIPRTPDGRPDLTGIYDANTLTQIERPANPVLRAAAVSMP